MAEGLRLELTGAEESLATLAEAAANAAHPRGLYDNIGAYLVSSTQRRFELGEGPDGTPWKPSYRVLSEGGKTLVDTSLLVGSINHEASDRGVAVGTNLIYAAIHQLGGVIRPVQAERLHFRLGNQDIFATKVEMPARPFLGIDDDDELEIERISADWLGAEAGD